MERNWSDLPCDLLSQLAKCLGLIDFLGFRGVCKDWRRASSKISVEDKSTASDPWFLFYEEKEGSQCCLVQHSGRYNTMNIPELHGATFLASYLGWLLIFNHGSLFFFCPFSRAKIELPSCPFTHVIEHVAAFTCAPTSQNCIVVVANRRNADRELELFMLCRGSKLWSKHSFSGARFHTIRAAFFYHVKEEFHILDGGHNLVTFNAKTKGWKEFYLVSSDQGNEQLEYAIRKNALHLQHLAGKDGWLKDNVSVSTCGTVTPHFDADYDLIIQNERIEAAIQPESGVIKGVWIQPSYIYVPPDQSW